MYHLTPRDHVHSTNRKATQAANACVGDEERKDIQSDLDNLSAEIHEILENSDFNGRSLFADSTESIAATAFDFHVGDGADDTYGVSINALTFLHALASSSAGSWVVNVSTVANTTSSIGTLESVINVLSDRLAPLGSDQQRLTFKQQNIQTTLTSYASARSQIEDADFAREQMEIAKLMILQQTGTVSLIQANIAPRAIMSLMAG